MASRTQLRLGQITGSFGDAEGKIVDNLATAATLGAIPIGSGSLVTALSQLASSIQRINGGAAFSSQAAGEFNHDLVIKGTTPTLTIGDGGDEDTSLVFDQSGQDFYIGVDATDDDLKIGLGNAVGTGTAITLDGDANVTLAGDITVSGGNLTIADDAKIKDAGGHERFSFTNAGNSVFGAADGSAGITLAANNSLVTIAGDLTISGNDLDFAAGDANIGASVGANELTIGGSTTDVVVPGNFIVQGDSTILTSSNTVIKDSIIGLATSGSEGYGPSGVDRGIVFGGGDIHAKQPAVYYDGSASKFVMATQTVSPASGSFPATPAQGDLATLIVSEVQFAFDGNDAIVSDGTDLEMSTAGNLNLVSTVDEEGSIYLRENGGTDGTIKIQADQGTGVNTKGNSTDASIALLSDVGGIGIYSGINNENAIAIEANGGTNEGIQIRSNQGTGAAAFGLAQVSDSSIAISSDAGGIAIASGLNNERAILLEVDAGTDETLSIHSNQGTGVNTKGNSTDASINLSSDAGGIGLYSALNGDNAITLESNGGANETIQIRSNQGTGVATANIANAVNASIALVSDVGGIAALSGLNGDGAIFIGADAGANETVRIHSHQGTGVGGTGDEGVNASISLVSDAGGVALVSGLDNAASVYMKGFGFTFDGGDQNDSFLFNNSPIQFEDITAPSDTAGKLYNNGGDLFFNGGALGSGAITKGVFLMTGSLAADTTFPTDTSNEHHLGASQAVENLAESDAQGKTLDVYVNGQLLVSGSNSEITGGTRDYQISGVGALKFAFDLELDDVVQVIKRG
jgi:hypothetical protein